MASGKISFFESFFMLVYEPIFWAIGIILLANRVQVLVDYSRQYTNYTLLQLINMDMQMNLLFYIAFFVLFAIWMVGKAIQWKSAKEKHDLLISLIRNQTYTTKRLYVMAKKIERKVDKLIASDK